jgi:signal transduction histidine kinase/ligand-binding sensor domain-containing protein
MEDRYGFIWIGTQYGLDRYDGYTVTRMSDVEYEGSIISMEWIWSISEDRNGTLWVCSSRGLFRYDRTSDRFELMLPNSKDPTSEDNSIYSIWQDSRGIHWIFTRGGLFTFDEQKDLFRDFPEDSIIGREIYFDWDYLIWYNERRIEEDTSGNIWICTTQGLKRYDPQKDSIVTYYNDPDDPGSISGNVVGCIREDNFGNVWFVAYSDSTRKDELNRVIDAEKGIFKRYRHDPADPKSLPGDWFFPLFVSSDSTFWIGGLNWFSRYNYETDDFTSYRLPGGENLQGGVTKIMEDSKGNLWMIRRNWGLTSFNPRSEVTCHFWCDHTSPDNLLPDYHLYNVIEDRNGDIWTLGQGGITRSEPFQKQFHTILSDTMRSDPYELKLINTVYFDPGGSFWFGGEFGLYRSPDYKPGGKNEFIRVTHFWSYCMIRDSGGQLWLGTNGRGLGRINENNNKIRFYRWNQDHPDSLSSNYITMMHRDRNGIFWMLPFERGINIFDPNSDRFISIDMDPQDPESPVSRSFWAIGEDRHGDMWFGSFNEGLSKLEMSTNLAEGIGDVFNGTLHRDSLKFRFKNFKSNPLDPNSVSGNQVVDMHTDASGRLWIATTSGLSLYNEKEDKFYAYTIAHGLPDNVILGILEDGHGNLWLSTQRGICKVILEDGIGPDLIKSVKSYRSGDGLQGDVFFENTCHTSIDGWMCFGGMNGLTIFHPDSIKDNDRIPPVYITGIRINDQSIYQQESPGLETSLFETEQIELPFKQNSLAFEFTALNYSNAEQNRYRYRMKGLDAEWVEAGARRYADYRDLKPGEYTFRVQGSNDDGVWNEEGASIGILINPPWYRTIFAYLVYIVVFAVAVYGYIRWRTWRIRKERDELDALVKQRTSIIQDQNKAILSANTLLEERKEELEQQTEELSQQKEELQNTLDRLKETQEQLIQSEKLAALGGLVAGVAHEINTPVGICVTAASNLAEETKAMADKFKANKISRAEFKDYLSTANKSAQLILANMERTASMIQSFKMVSADQTTGQKRRVVLRSYMEDIIRSLYPKLKGRRISINLDVDPNLEIESYPGAVSQIFTNLILNSLTHGFENMEKGEISVQTSLNDGILNIIYTDTGHGISEENLNKIFEPFFTTNKKVGTGLGLHIVYNLVTQKLNGSISCESKPGEGAEFRIVLPVS